MNNLQSTMRRVLEACDVAGYRAINAQYFPHHPQPESDAQAERELHDARTRAEFLDLKRRAYSHRWLTERNLPSGLPDHLKPAAEQLCPRVVDAVGIALGSHSSLVKQALVLVRKPMEEAILELHGDDVSLSDPETVPLVRQRMQEAKDREMNALFGRLTGAGIP